MSAIGRLLPQSEAVMAWGRTQWLARRLQTRGDIEKWQRRRIERLLRGVLPGMAAYGSAQRFADLPIIDKATLMARFEAHNRPGITAEAGFRALATGGRIGRYFVGASTGTSGNRGLYVISEAERWRWLGTMLAKAMPRLRRARVALILPLDTSLYDAARRSPVLEFRFLDLKRGLEACGAAVAAFDPDTLIAPPKVLRWLAGQDWPMARLEQVFSAAEVLDPIDRKVIEARFGVRVREIYMATEGLLGVACTHSTLHLAEDTMKFEFEPVPGSDLVSPIITDFSRETQAMVRYRMNDLLRLADPPCPCGSPLQAVVEVVGRMDDMLLLPSGDRSVSVTPDIVRNAIVGADRRIDDFRLVQTGKDLIELSLLEAMPIDAVEAAERALAGLLASLGVEARTTVRRPPVLEVSAHKLRRVERRWRM